MLCFALAASLVAEAAEDCTLIEDAAQRLACYDARQATNLDLASTIKAVRRPDKQKMVFLLENDQVWLQDSPRPLPIREGQQVTIKSGRLGGHILTAENGASTRVRRVK